MLGSNDAGVAPPVISFFNSSNVKPTASFAAIFAIGKPVAFDAKADERDTRGLQIAHSNHLYPHQFLLRPQSMHYA
jgi:hypothetical protein